MIHCLIKLSATFLKLKHGLVRLVHQFLPSYTRKITPLAVTWFLNENSLQNTAVFFCVHVYMTLRVQVEKLMIAKQHGCYDVIHCDETR